jgi:DnaJ-class molecular chaperone
LHHEEPKTVKNLGLPFYKDPMSYGHLYIEFLVDFPKKNFLSAANLTNIAKILGGNVIKTDGYSKNNKNKILEDFQENDLNANPTGGAEN